MEESEIVGRARLLSKVHTFIIHTNVFTFPVLLAHEVMLRTIYTLYKFFRGNTLSFL